MTPDPLVSIVMPVFNPPEERFRHCLDSVVGQSCEQFELLLVDDGSNESTKRIIHDYLRDDQRISCISSGHRGPAAARNIGTQAVRGQYVTYVDSDDAIPGYTLERMVETSEKHHAQVAFGLCSNVSSYADELPVYGSNALLDEREIDGLLDYVLAGSSRPFFHGGQRYNLLIGPVASLVDAKLAKKLSFPEDVFISEDTLWMISMLKVVETIAISRDVWYWRWLNEGSLAHSFQPRIYDNSVEFMKELRLLEKEPGRMLKKEFILARGLGEVNRVAKNYARQEWSGANSPEMRNPGDLLKEDSFSDLLTAENILNGGPSILLKTILIKTGLVVPFWKYASTR